MTRSLEKEGFSPGLIAAIVKGKVSYDPITGELTDLAHKRRTSESWADQAEETESKLCEAPNSTCELAKPTSMLNVRGKGSKGTRPTDLRAVRECESLRLMLCGQLALRGGADSQTVQRAPAIRFSAGARLEKTVAWV